MGCSEDYCALLHVTSCDLFTWLRIVLTFSLDPSSRWNSIDVKLEAENSSETSMKFYETTWHLIQQDSLPVSFCTISAVRVCSERFTGRGTSSVDHCCPIFHKNVVFPSSRVETGHLHCTLNHCGVSKSQEPPLSDAAQQPSVEEISFSARHKYLRKMEENLSSFSLRQKLLK